MVADLIFVAQVVKSKLARECDSHQFLFIDRYFHVFTNMRMTEQFQHWIPSVVLLQPI